jgi:hypothetical protein
LFSGNAIESEVIQMEGWACIAKAAKYADVSEKTMRDWLKVGLKHSRVSRRILRIKYSDIDEFLKAHLVDENFVDTVIADVFRETPMKRRKSL